MSIWNLLETARLIIRTATFYSRKTGPRTLLQIIKNEIKTEMTIHSDQWRAYSTLNHHGYINLTVNHLEFFIDPETKVHTQEI
jgi:hypothetical protein